MSSLTEPMAPTQPATPTHPTANAALTPTDPTDPANSTPAQPRRIRARDAVRVVKAFGADQAAVHIGLVLSVSPSTPDNVGTNGEPAITVAFMDPNAAAHLVSSSNWHQAFERIASVRHYTNPEAQAGKHGIFWVDFMDDDEKLQDLPEGVPLIVNGTSAVFSRRHSEQFFDQDPRTVPPRVQGIPGRPVPVNQQGGIPLSGEVGPVETKTYTDGTTVTGVAPLPDLSPAQQSAQAAGTLDPEPTPTLHTGSETWLPKSRAGGTVPASTEDPATGDPTPLV